MKTIIIILFLCIHVEILELYGHKQQQSNITHSTATLSEARCCLAATSLGGLVFFGGGQNSTQRTPSARVDICNVTSGSWTTATLSIPRAYLAAASSGNIVFFAGGENNGTVFYNQVDIYNVSDGSWSNATLSQSRSRLAATSIENLVLFGGGWNSSSIPFNVVDIYNVTSNTWTTATLSQTRCCLAATSVANRYALFGGGWNRQPSNVVDIYDSTNGGWSTATLSSNRSDPCAASVGDLALFAGGDNGSFSQTFNVVDIYNSTTGLWSTAILSQNRTHFAAASIGEIVAFGGGASDGATLSSTVDMFNVTSESWLSTTTLSQSRYDLAATSSNNKIFFGGGNDTTNSESFSNIVDIFDLTTLSPSLPTPQSLSSSSSPPPTPTTVMSSVPSQSPSTTVSSSSQISSPLTPFQIISSTNSVTPTQSSSTSLSTGAIVGIVVGILALFIAVGFILFLILFIRRKRKQTHRTKQQQKDKYPMEQLKNETILNESVRNADNWTTLNTMTTTLSTYQPGTGTLQSLSPGQIPLHELEIGKEIGQGTYGRVCIGKWKKYQVALKFCQNRGKMDEFLKEANLMMSLPPHPNVVRMYGVSIDGTQPIIVMEYCAGGSLDKLLYDTTEPIPEKVKIEWVCEIAKGMYHLHKYNIVHRDLAARNILLSHPYPNTAHLKISDFGMSRVLQQEIQLKTSRGIGPVCWMAPESIGQHLYSKKSDVWMFGILVYEIVARCEPHLDKNQRDVPSLIRDRGLTPTIPNDCPLKLRQLMEMCWNKQPDQRPTFESICALFDASIPIAY